MFTQFRTYYPKGSLLTELITIDHGKYVVRCLVQNDGINLASGLAAAETIELAEDKARSRALEVLELPTISVNSTETVVVTSEVTIPSFTASKEPETAVVTSEVAIPSFTASKEPETLLPTPEVTIPISPAPVAAQEVVVPKSEPIELTPHPEVAAVSDTKNISSLESKRKKKKVEAVVTTPVVSEDITLDQEFSSPVETVLESETPLVESEAIPSTQFNDTLVSSSVPQAAENTDNTLTSPDTPIDFSEIIARTNVELKRLGWTNQQGRDYLIQTYGKRSRQLLSDAELLDFLSFLESEPTPEGR